MRQKGARSVRWVRRSLAELACLVSDLVQVRGLVTSRLAAKG
jgi:hypothetical protein